MYKFISFISLYNMLTLYFILQLIMLSTVMAKRVVLSCMKYLTWLSQKCFLSYVQPGTLEIQEGYT